MEEERFLDLEFNEFSVRFREERGIMIFWFEGLPYDGSQGGPYEMNKDEAKSIGEAFVRFSQKVET